MYQSYEGISQSLLFIVYSKICDNLRRESIAYAKTKAQISCAVTAQLISAFVFTTSIIHFLFFLNPKFQACSLLLWLYRSVCVRPGRRPQRPIFYRHGSMMTFILTQGKNTNNKGRAVAQYVDKLSDSGLIN